MNKKYWIMVFLLICSVSCIFGQIEPELQEKRKKFASEGFGFTYIKEEMDNFNVFILNHGQPLNITERTEINRHDGITDKIITLEYEKYIIVFYVWGKRETGYYPPVSMLVVISSKDKINYLYNIRHGMTKEELDNIIGITEIENNIIWIDGNKGNLACIHFTNNIVEHIEWYYSLE